MKVLIIDNFDSFTYNLHHYVSQFEIKCDVVRNDNLENINISDYNKIILSPGPSLPSDHINIFNFLKQNYKTISILGICLGHQAIAEFFGSKLENLKKVKHGITSENNVLSEDVLFKNLPKKFTIGHYHSWVVDKNTLPTCLEITSENKEGLIMSFSHKEYDLKGIQFHPESVLTEVGITIIKNWIES